MFRIASAFALAATVSAQGYLFFPSDAPGSGACSRAPFGAESADLTHRNQLFQTVFTAAELGNRRRVISTLSFAPCGAGTHSYGRLAIRANHLSGAFTSDFRSNIGSGAAKLLDVTSWEWAHGADAWTEIRVDRPFVYDPARGDLVIEVRVTNADFQGAEPRFHETNRAGLLANSYSGAPPRTGTPTTSMPRIRLGDRVAAVSRYGFGCGAGPLNVTSQGMPRLGSSFTVGLGGVRTGVTAAGVIWVGFQRLDRHLMSAGAPGCWLLSSIDIDIPVTVGNGVSSPVSIPVPNDPAIAGGHAFVQGIHIDPAANALGVVLSDGLNLAVGF